MAHTLRTAVIQGDQIQIVVKVCGLGFGESISEEMMLNQAKGTCAGFGVGKVCIIREQQDYQ